MFRRTCSCGYCPVETIFVEHMRRDDKLEKVGIEAIRPQSYTLRTRLSLIHNGHPENVLRDNSVSDQYLGLLVSGACRNMAVRPNERRVASADNSRSVHSFKSTKPRGDMSAILRSGVARAKKGAVVVEIFRVHEQHDPVGKKGVLLTSIFKIPRIRVLD